MIKRQSYRKAVLFTLISVLLAGLFIALYSSNIFTNMEDSTPATNTRIRVLDNYVKNFEKYTQDSLKVSTYRTLESMYNYALVRRRFYTDFNDFNNTFYNCLTCAYLNCSTNATPCPAPITGYDINTLLGNISSLAYNNLNIVTNYSIESVKIYQQYPFEVDVELAISYNVYDKSKDNYASWSMNTLINQSVSIIDLVDPTEGINTNNAYARNIRKTSICAYNETCWNLSNTKQFYDRQEFRYYNNGTNYLERFWNETTPSGCCGLESLINISYVSGNASFVDHYYWNNIGFCNASLNTTKTLEIDLITPGFMFDEATAGRYGVTNFGDVICPPQPP